MTLLPIDLNLMTLICYRKVQLDMKLILANTPNQAINYAYHLVQSLKEILFLLAAFYKNELLMLQDFKFTFFFTQLSIFSYYINHDTAKMSMHIVYY